MVKSTRQESLNRALGSLYGSRKLLEDACKNVDSVRNGGELSVEESAELAASFQRLRLADDYCEKYHLRSLIDWDAELTLERKLGGDTTPVVVSRLGVEPGETISTFVMDVWPHLDAQQRLRLVSYVNRDSTDVTISHILDEQENVVVTADEKGDLGWEI